MLSPRGQAGSTSVGQAFSQAVLSRARRGSGFAYVGCRPQKRAGFRTCPTVDFREDLRSQAAPYATAAARVVVVKKAPRPAAPPHRAQAQEARATARA